MSERTRADGSKSASELKDENSAEKQDNLRDSGGMSTDGVADSAKRAASKAKEAAGQAFGQAKEQAASQADEKRQTIASGLQTVAQAFRNLGDDLRTTKEQGPITNYVSEIGQALGGQVERAANHLRERDVRELFNETEDFARRSPTVFLGGAFILGLAASRFLKSSRPASTRHPKGDAPDPSRALPPATTPTGDLGPTQPSNDLSKTPPFWATESEQSSSGAGPSGAKPASVGHDPASV